MCPSCMPLSYLQNVSAITEPVISQTIMMHSLLPPVQGSNSPHNAKLKNVSSSPRGQSAEVMLALSFSHNVLN